MKLWTGQTISEFGSLITAAALPFTAVLVLQATPLQMALLSAADLLPGFLFGLFAGVWVDRLPRRPILIATDLGRAVLLGSIPAAAIFGVLHLEQLYVVAFLAGILTRLFGVAYRAYLPTLVKREALLEANSKLSASGSVAEVGAFPLAGWLVQWFTGPFAILIDAVSFLFSALFVGWIRASEPVRMLTASHPSMRREIGEGFRAVVRHPLLRVLAVATITRELSFRVFGTVFMLFVTRELGFAPGVLGMIFAVGGVSSLCGAVVAGGAARRFGVGPAMIGGLLFAGLGLWCVPVAGGASVGAVVLLVAQQLLTDGAWTVYEINEVTLRQTVTPDHLLGRVNASISVVGLGAMLCGSLVGGVLGETIGLRATLAVSAAVMCLAALGLVLTSVRGLRDSRPPQS